MNIGVLVLNLVLLVVGFVLLVKGADWFVEAVSAMAVRLGIPQIIIGLTIVAMGTSLPEASVSITAAAKGSADISIGNILGSNIMNVWLILGLAAVFAVVLVQKDTLCIDIPFVLGITVLLLVFGLTGNVISRVEGIVFIALFVGYLFYLYRSSKNAEAEEDEASDMSVGKILFFTLFGACCIVGGSKVVVSSASELARLFGMSERFIGLTIVAFGTSLPELVTSTMAAMKGKTDIAIGNIVGSNMFNILFVVGITAIILPVPYAAGFLFDNLVAIGVVLSLILFLIRDRKLTRGNGLCMLGLYAAYFSYIVLK